MIHACLDGSNEYFNGTEWKSLSEYQEDGEEWVLQYYPNGSSVLVKPTIFIRELNNDPVYESLDDNVPTMGTKDMVLVFTENSKLCQEKFETFFQKRSVTENCNLIGSSLWVNGEDFLTYKQIILLSKIIKKGNLKYAKKNPELMGYVDIENGICLSKRFFSMGLLNRGALVQELGLQKGIGYIPFDCAGNQKLADQLWTLYQLSGNNKRCYVTEYNGDYYLYKPVPFDNGMYAPDNVEISTSGDIFYSYFRNDIGSILEKNSNLFKYHTESSVKYGIGVDSGMIVLRRKGTMFVVGC